METKLKQLKKLGLVLIGIVAIILFGGLGYLYWIYKINIQELFIMSCVLGVSHFLFLMGVHFVLEGSEQP